MLQSTVISVSWSPYTSRVVVHAKSPETAPLFAHSFWLSTVTVSGSPRHATPRRDATRLHPRAARRLSASTTTTTLPLPDSQSSQTPPNFFESPASPSHLPAAPCRAADVLLQAAARARRRHGGGSRRRAPPPPVLAPLQEALLLLPPRRRRRPPPRSAGAEP